MTLFDGLQQVVNDKIKSFDHVANALTIKVTTEIKKAKNELKPSAFNEIANQKTKGIGMSPHFE